MDNKIKKLEEKTTGSISTNFDIDINELFASYTEQEIEEDQMFNFIRDEWLNMMIARKMYAKEQQEKKKKEAKEARDKAKAQKQLPIEEERKVRLPP